MSAGAITGTTGTDDLPEDDTIFELTGGENPMTFLDMNEATVMGLIAGMSDPDRIEGWRQAEENYVDSDRDTVLEALDRQAAALEAGQTPPIYHPIHERYDEADDPLVDEDASSTDGDKAAREDTSETAPKTVDEPHPEANLEAGEVLIVDRPETKEYVWPARADAEDPYILREFDSGEQRQEMTLSASDAFDRLNFDPDKRRIDSVSVDAPLEAATNRGDEA